jgi:hypothetical protein
VVHVDEVFGGEVAGGGVGGEDGVAEEVEVALGGGHDVGAGWGVHVEERADGGGDRGMSGVRWPV